MSRKLEENRKMGKVVDEYMMGNTRIRICVDPSEISTPEQREAKQKRFGELCYRLLEEQILRHWANGETDYRLPDFSGFRYEDLPGYAPRRELDT